MPDDDFLLEVTNRFCRPRPPPGTSRRPRTSEGLGLPGGHFFLEDARPRMCEILAHEMALIAHAG